MKNGIVIAGTQSGVGKTTLTIGLMAALKKRGLQIQGFKVGPDYLDPTYHRIVTDRWSHNLDGWMTSKDYVSTLYEKNSSTADISIIEGAMGLFDGYGATSEEGSAAQIAKWLDLPVILVVNGKGMSRSACALIKGYLDFDPDLHVAGVVFNNLGSKNHLRILKEAVEATLPVQVFGGLLRQESLKMPERHLGLTTADDSILNNCFINELVNTIEEHIEVDEVLNLIEYNPEHFHANVITKVDKEAQHDMITSKKVGIAFDKAFHFYYKANLDALEEAGAELCFFSPLEDDVLPEGLDALYLGGGYPELFAKKLSENTTMLEAIKAFAESEKPLYAECGGLIYLSQSVTNLEGDVLPFASVFPFSCRMLPKRKALGYVEVILEKDSIIGTKGESFRGHEFHYSEIIDEGRVQKNYRLKKRRGGEDRFEGYSKKNVLASYVHLHFASNKNIIEHFLGNALKA